jgi:hypothetical protein
MRFKHFYFLLFLLPLPAFSIGVFGTITDKENTPLSYVLVYISGTSIGTISNEKGEYKLELNSGSHKLTFQSVGYISQVQSIQLKDSLVKLNVALAPSVIELKTFTVRDGSREHANKVIREAQKKRKKYLNQVDAYSCKVYIKGIAKINKYLPKKIAGVAIRIDAEIDSSTGIVYLSESESNYYFKQPDKIFEELVASKTSGQKALISYNRASEMDFNFYKSTLNNPELSPRGFISPIASDAFRFYRYKLVGTFYDNKDLVNKIQVEPKRNGDPVFKGTICIVENSWRLHSCSLYLEKNTGIEWVDTLFIQQEYVQVSDSIWMPFKNSITYSYSGLGALGKGVYTGIYSNYKLNEQVPDSLFTSQKIYIQPSALSKDTNYWNANRIIPLTQEESRNYKFRDSLAALRNSSIYINSLERKQNKLHWKDLILGYTFRKSTKDLKVQLEPMYDNISFNTVQGLVLTPTLSATKKIGLTKEISLSGTFGYGFSNKKKYGFGHVNYDYNPRRLAQIRVSGGKDMLQFNSNAISPLVNTLYTLLLRENFMKLFEKNFIRFDHRIELKNGLLFFAACEYADRNPLLNTTNFSFFRIGDEFQSNDPQFPSNTQFAFFRNQSFHAEGAIQFTPFQPYYFEGNSKKFKTSKFPTFTVFYKRALPGVLKSDVDLDLIKLGLDGTISWKRNGHLSYVFEGGQFVNRTQMSFMDWKYFNGNKTLYSNFSGKDFQLLDYYSNSSNSTYFQMHLLQNFNGLILSHIPLLKKAKIQELLIANVLLTEDNLTYTEFGIGLQKKFIRLDYMLSFTNGIYSDAALRFGFLF